MRYKNSRILLNATAEIGEIDVFVTRRVLARSLCVCVCVRMGKRSWLARMHITETLCCPRWRVPWHIVNVRTLVRSCALAQAYSTHQISIRAKVPSQVYIYTIRMRIRTYRIWPKSSNCNCTVHGIYWVIMTLLAYQYVCTHTFPSLSHPFNLLVSLLGSRSTRSPCPIFIQYYFSHDIFLFLYRF